MKKETYTAKCKLLFLATIAGGFVAIVMLGLFGWAVSIAGDRMKHAEEMRGTQYFRLVCQEHGYPTNTPEEREACREQHFLGILETHWCRKLYDLDSPDDGPSFEWFYTLPKIGPDGYSAKKEPCPVEVLRMEIGAMANDYAQERIRQQQKQTLSTV